MSIVIKCDDCGAVFEGNVKGDWPQTVFKEAGGESYEYHRDQPPYYLVQMDIHRCKVCAEAFKMLSKEEKQAVRDEYREAAS